MPAFLVSVYRCPSRANAEQVQANFDPGDFSVAEYDTTIHDAPPVILAGLVKGGEYASAEEFSASVSPMDALCLAADGRVVSDYGHACAAESRGALPITWYLYP